MDNLHLAIRPGEVFGLLGPNGAGKTTVLNMLVGFHRPTAGMATVEGFSIASEIEKIYKLMGVCPQHNILWDMVTGEQMWVEDVFDSASKDTDSGFTISSLLYNSRPVYHASADFQYC